jgi:hypothetical protein
MAGGPVAELHESQTRCFFKAFTEACVNSDMLMISAMTVGALNSRNVV